jgi:hypothetical protein
MGPLSQSNHLRDTLPVKIFDIEIENNDNSSRFDPDFDPDFDFDAEQ